MLDTFAVAGLATIETAERDVNTSYRRGVGAYVAIAADQAAEEVRRFLAGEPPLNPC